MDLNYLFFSLNFRVLAMFGVRLYEPFNSCLWLKNKIVNAIANNKKNEFQVISKCNPKSKF